MIKQTAKEALLLILAAVGIAVIVYAVRPDKIGNLSEEVDPGTAKQSVTESGFSEISLADAVQLHEERKAIFADARHAADFQAGHIAGAVHLYVADQEMWLTEFLATTDPSTLIITYCDGEACHLAAELADVLILNGFGNVHYLKNGWSRWREGGYPVEH